MASVSSFSAVMPSLEKDRGSNSASELDRYVDQVLYPASRPGIPLSEGEIARIQREEFLRTRTSRIVQVREQEKRIAAARRKAYQAQLKQKRDRQIASQEKLFQEHKLRKIGKAQNELRFALGSVGQAHNGAQVEMLTKSAMEAKRQAQMAKEHLKECERMRVALEKEEAEKSCHPMNVSRRLGSQRQSVMRRTSMMQRERAKRIAEKKKFGALLKRRMGVVHEDATEYAALDHAGPRRAEREETSKEPLESYVEQIGTRLQDHIPRKPVAVEIVAHDRATSTLTKASSEVVHPDGFQSAALLRRRAEEEQERAAQEREARERNLHARTRAAHVRVRMQRERADLEQQLALLAQESRKESGDKAGATSLDILRYSRLQRDIQRARKKTERAFERAPIAEEPAFGGSVDTGAAQGPVHDALQEVRRGRRGPVSRVGHRVPSRADRATSPAESPRATFVGETEAPAVTRDVSDSLKAARVRRSTRDAEVQTQEDSRSPPAEAEPRRTERRKGAAELDGRTAARETAPPARRSPQRTKQEWEETFAKALNSSLTEGDDVALDDETRQLLEESHLARKEANERVKRLYETSQLSGLSQNEYHTAPGLQREIASKSPSKEQSARRDEARASRKQEQAHASRRDSAGRDGAVVSSSSSTVSTSDLDMYGSAAIAASAAAAAAVRAARITASNASRFPSRDELETSILDYLESNEDDDTNLSWQLRHSNSERPRAVSELAMSVLKELEGEEVQLAPELSSQRTDRGQSTPLQSNSRVAPRFASSAVSASTASSLQQFPLTPMSQESYAGTLWANKGVYDESDLLELVSLDNKSSGSEEDLHDGDEGAFDATGRPDKSAPADLRAQARSSPGASPASLARQELPSTPLVVQDESWKDSDVFISWIRQVESSLKPTAASNSPSSEGATCPKVSLDEEKVRDLQSNINDIVAESHQDEGFQEEPSKEFVMDASALFFANEDRAREEPSDRTVVDSSTVEAGGAEPGTASSTSWTNVTLRTRREPPKDVSADSRLSSARTDATPEDQETASASSSQNMSLDSLEKVQQALRNAREELRAAARLQAEHPRALRQGHSREIQEPPSRGVMIGEETAAPEAPGFGVARNTEKSSEKFGSSLDASTSRAEVDSEEGTPHDNLAGTRASSEFSFSELMRDTEGGLEASPERRSGADDDAGDLQEYLKPAESPMKMISIDGSLKARGPQESELGNGGSDSENLEATEPAEGDPLSPGGVVRGNEESPESLLEDRPSFSRSAPTAFQINFDAADDEDQLLQPIEVPRQRHSIERPPSAESPDLLEENRGGVAFDVSFSSDQDGLDHTALSRQFAERSAKRAAEAKTRAIERERGRNSLSREGDSSEGFALWQKQARRRSGQPPSSELLSRLAAGERAAVDKAEQKRRTSRLYKALPEVLERNKEQEKEREAQERRQRVREMEEKRRRSLKARRMKNW